MILKPYGCRGSLEGDWGLISGRFRADPYQKNYMAVSINCGVLFMGVRIIRRALLFGVHIRAPDCLENPT